VRAPAAVMKGVCMRTERRVLSVLALLATVAAAVGLSPLLVSSLAPVLAEWGRETVAALALGNDEGFGLPVLLALVAVALIIGARSRRD